MNKHQLLRILGFGSIPAGILVAGFVVMLSSYRHIEKTLVAREEIQASLKCQDIRDDDNRAFDLERKNLRAEIATGRSMINSQRRDLEAQGRSISRYYAVNVHLKRELDRAVSALAGYSEVKSYADLFKLFNERVEDMPLPQPPLQ